MSVPHSLEIKADLDNLGHVRDFIEANVESAGLSEDSAGELLLAIDEAVSNIIMHGFKSAANGDIELEVKHQPEAILVHIRDNAPLFDPTKGSNPHLEVSPLERDAPGGFGVYLLNHLVDKIAYRVTDDGRNELTMLKKSGPKNPG
jgi:anti-sigma regulatory factor (Ser/Thr protein kinase)